jgi:hypothetical protein
VPTRSIFLRSHPARRRITGPLAELIHVLHRFQRESAGC